jgi:hypothetical protein
MMIIILRTVIIFLLFAVVVNNAIKTFSSRSPILIYHLYLKQMYSFLIFFVHNNYIVSIRIKIIVFSHK